MVLIETDRRPGQGVAVPRRRDGNVLVPGGLRQPGIVAPPMGDFPIARPKDTPTREFHSRSRTEFLQAGGTFRMLDLSAEAQDEGLPTEDWEAVRRVRGLYTHPDLIEHFAGVIPSYRVGEMLAWYRANPRARLIVAEMPGVGVVGVNTLAPEERGIYGAKLNRLVVDPEHGQDYRHTARDLVLHTLAYAFSVRDRRGFSYYAVTVGVIQDVKGCEIPEQLFRGLGWSEPELYPNRCEGWRWVRGEDGHILEGEELKGRKHEPVRRNVRRMVLHRHVYQANQRERRKAQAAANGSESQAICETQVAS